MDLRCARPLSFHCSHRAALTPSPMTFNACDRGRVGKRRLASSAAPAPVEPPAAFAGLWTLIATRLVAPPSRAPCRARAETRARRPRHLPGPLGALAAMPWARHLCRRRLAALAALVWPPFQITQDCALLLVSARALFYERTSMQQGYGWVG